MRLVQSALRVFPAIDDCADGNTHGVEALGNSGDGRAIFIYDHGAALDAVADAQVNFATQIESRQIIPGTIANEYGVVNAFVQIVDIDLGTKLARSYPNGGVDSRVEKSGLPKTVRAMQYSFNRSSQPARPCSTV